ncbi:MAG: methyltransferase domain-containing protein [Armatimonadetes bacterium]|nr:methyltransferase domain-containing protein [Armatimonadota bacterium]
MKRDLVPLLRCPTGCASELSLRADERASTPEILSGAVVCRDCGREYPIQRSILRMLPHDLTSDTAVVPASHHDHATIHKRSEMKARDSQTRAYERMWHLNLFGRIEIPITMRPLRLSRHHNLLEAGCGTGRMTRSFAGKCDRLVAVDFSLRSLQRNRANLRRRGVKNVDLIQADLCRLPIRAEAFDRVVSCQVLEHIPTVESRESAVRELARVLRKGGRLVLSAYQHSLLTSLFGEKEGEHAGGIYFYRFDRRELRRLLERALEVRSITGILVYHYIASCRK